VRAILAFVVLSVLAGCHVEPPPVGALSVAGAGRVYKIGPHDYRGPQLSAAQFVALRAFEPDRKWCDIKLNTAWPGDGGHDVLPDGIEEFDHPWQPFGPVSHTTLREAVDDAEACERAGGATYRHCLHGEDRTGLELGIERIDAHAPACSAWREMIAYGFHDGEINKPGLPGLVETFEREAGVDVARCN
jgi:hypothetical protein